MLKSLLLYISKPAFSEAKTVKQVITAKDSNNLTLLRLLASLLVIFGHSFLLFNPANYSDPNITYFHISSGSLGVNIFFFISGILITQSYFSNDDKFRFWIMRIFRIWPAYVVCILFAILVIGPIFTTYPLSDYFTNSGIKKYLLNIFLIRSYLYDGLPGVFLNNYLHFHVNGSLWTLYYELLCYLLLFCAATVLINIKSKQFILKVLFLFATILLVLTPSAFKNFVTFILYDAHVFRLMGHFLVGVIVYLLSDKIKVSVVNFVMAILVFMMLYPLNNHPFFSFVFNIAMMYSVLCFAYFPFLQRLKMKNDYSYGIYLYGFLIQQAVASQTNLGAYQSMLLTIPLSIILGMFSWHLIEKRFLSFAKKLSKKYSPQHTENVAV